MAAGFLLHGRCTAALAVVSCLASSAGAVTYRVGPGRPYANLQAVTSLLNPGDLVEVDGGATYPGDVTFGRPGTSANPIVIRGLSVGGRRPILSGGTNTVHFRTDVIGSGAEHYVLEGFEITGGTSRCVFHQSNDLTLRDLVVHDCPAQGILGADWGSGSLTLEHSEVYRCGSGTYNHQIYIGMDEDNYPDGVFRMQYNWVHDATGGNNVKSRAARNEIYYNRIEGAYYHELELIGAECCAEAVVREDSDVVGNLLVKKGANANFAVTRLGGDGTAQTWGRYRFVNNTIIVTGTSAVFRLFDGLQSVEMHNNVLHRGGGLPVNVTRTVEAVWTNGLQISGSNNWVTTGSTNVPTAWVSTRTGTNPGFADPSGENYSLLANSPLLNAGNGSPSSNPSFPFPRPSFPPAYQPPGVPGVFGRPNPRPVLGAIDIGAYEGVARARDVMLRRTTGEVQVLQSTGSAFTGLGTNWTSGFAAYRYDVFFADADGDGRSDLVSRNRDTGNVEVFRSTGTSFAYAAGSGPGGVWSYGWGTSYDLYFADATGDGRADLVGRYRPNGDVYVFASTGSGFSSASPSGRWSYGWSSGYDLYFADVTGDGRADILSRYYGPTAGLTGHVYVGLSSGSGFLSPTLWTYGYSAGYELYFGDATGDGKADLVARYYGPTAGLTGDVYVMASTGAQFAWPGGSSARWTYGWGSTYDLLLRDVTGDGKADLVGRHRGNAIVYVARSTGSSLAYIGEWATGVDTSYELR